MVAETSETSTDQQSESVTGDNNMQAIISAFWLVKSLSINPKSVQKSEIECKKLKLSEKKKWNWVQNGEIIVIDSSYLSSDKQNGGQKLNEHWNSVSKFQHNYLITKQSAKLNNNY